MSIANTHFFFFSFFFSLLPFRQTSVSNGLSLKSLAADVLKISLDKSPEVRCSDWEADQLTKEQVGILLYCKYYTCTDKTLVSSAMPN